MKGDLKGGKLIGEGSGTCVFKPNLPCKNGKIDVDNKKVSKLFLKKPENIKKEIDFNEKISKLPKSKEWSITLHEHCEAPDYETIKKVEPDIDKCLKNNKYSKLQNFDMLYGPYGGVSMDIAFQTYMIDAKNINDICETYKGFFKKCSSLFLGLDIMYKHKIMHYDIKSGNITYIDNRYKYIDFGISTTFKNKEQITKRALQEFNANRIYIYYPFDILYLYASKPKLYLEKYTNRKNYDDLKDLHEIVFDRDFDSEWEVILDLGIENGLNEKQIIEKLDTYSLGITLTKLLFDSILKKYNHMNDKDLYFMLKDIFNCDKFKNIKELLRDMTEPLATNRISPNKAYKRFNGLY